MQVWSPNPHRGAGHGCLPYVTGAPTFHTSHGGQCSPGPHLPPPSPALCSCAGDLCLVHRQLRAGPEVKQWWGRRQLPPRPQRPLSWQSPVATTLTLPGVEGTAQQLGHTVHPLHQGGSSQLSSGATVHVRSQGNQGLTRLGTLFPNASARALSVSTSGLVLPLPGQQ